MIISERLLRSEHNNLTFARIALASSVIYSHCAWQITGSDQDALSTYMGAPVSTFAVDGFFFISGFLVYRSLIAKPNIRRFAIARLARLWPGLAVMVLVVSAIGAFFSQDGLTEYLWSTARGFFIHNLTFFYASYTLPGVNCPDGSCIINGSLWTIPWEVRCYCTLALLYVTRLYKRKAMIGIVLPMTLLLGVLYSLPQINDWAHQSGPGGYAYYLDRADRLWFAFALGIAAYLLIDRVNLTWPRLLAGLIVSVTVNAFVPSLNTHVHSILAGYIVLSLGFLTCKTFGPFSAKWPDYSYGLYIYAFPVMLVLHWIGINTLPALVLANFGVTLLFAAASWHFVEKPAMDYIRSFDKRQYANKVGASAAHAIKG